jgi:hypothetical protein
VALVVSRLSLRGPVHSLPRCEQRSRR